MLIRPNYLFWFIENIFTVRGPPERAAAAGLHLVRGPPRLQADEHDPSGAELQIWIKVE